MFLLQHLCPSAIHGPVPQLAAAPTNFPVGPLVSLERQAELDRRLSDHHQLACKFKGKTGCYQLVVKGAETTLPISKRKRKCSHVRTKC